MFTGIIESIGSIRALTPKGGDVRVSIDTGKLDLGDGHAATVSFRVLPGSAGRVRVIVDRAAGTATLDEPAPSPAPPPHG